ncbi:MAG: CPBP family intramembrane metalloprotease [Chlorobiales bacterium]|nr:CPBP family intramembrane metalloprotease [Chlorobiales bacterium]
MLSDINSAGEKLPDYTGYFERQRFSPLLINFTVLVGILAVYLTAGSIATLLVSGIDLSQLSSGTSQFNITDQNLQLIRLVQFLAQVLIIALPVFFLVRLHTGQNPLIARENLAYLGLTTKASALEYIYPTIAVLVSHPLLSYAADLQLIMLDKLFGIGDDLAAQKEVMDKFIEKLAMIRSPLEFFAVVGLVAVTPAICEELLFRGYIQKNFTRTLNPALTVMLTGLIFGFYHLNMTETLPLCMLGIYISYLRQTSQALGVSMAVHFANNFFSVIGMFTINHADRLGLSPETIDQLNSDSPDISSVTAITSAILSLVLFSMATRLYKHEAKKRLGFQA